MRFINKNLCHGVLLMTMLLLSACGGRLPTSKTSETTLTPVTAPAPVVTSTGTDFYLTLPDHLCVSAPSLCNDLPVTNKLIIAAAIATTGEVTFQGVATPFAVAAGGQTVITLDPAVVLTSNEVIEAKGIHVTALSPVSVHVMSENATSADGYLALPVNGLGTNYYVMAKASSRYSGSEFALVATQNNTTVSITPRANGATKLAGVAFTVVLNSGETYQLANPASADMTGTQVSADKPVAVFSGHRCADVPSGVGYCDYLVEQLTDVSLWGKTFHTTPFSGRARYTVRVIASQDNTTFATVPAALIGTLNAGQFVDVDLSVAAEFVSSQPVQMAQYIRGYADDMAGIGDPSMVMVTPAEMGVSDETFGVHGLAGTSGAFISIVTETASLASLTLDNTPVDPARFNTIGGGSLYSAATIAIAPGAHTLVGTVPYTAVIYDYGIKWNAVSYAYPVASTLSIAGAISSTSSSSTEKCGMEGHEDNDRHKVNGGHNCQCKGDD